MPSAMNRATNTIRTQETGSPRCPARPRATPPSNRPSALRYSLRTGGSSGSGAGEKLVSARGGAVVMPSIVTRHGGPGHQGRP